MQKTKRCVALALAFFFLCATALLLTGCRHDDGTGKTFLFPLDTMPQRLDPAVAQTPNELLVVNNIFEGLVRVDAEGEIIPGAAYVWNMLPDGLTYIFHLRQDTHWFLGTQARAMLGLEADDEWDSQVTAHDFAFGIARALNPATRAPQADLLTNIADIHVANRYTLRLTLHEPDDAFLHALASSAAMPVNQEFFEATRGRFGLGVRYMLSNGPFYISLWESSRLRLVQHAGYVGHDIVAPATVNLLVQTNPNHRLNNLGGEGGWDVAFVSAAWEARVPDSAQVTRLHNATQVLQFNHENIYLRQALAAVLTEQNFGNAIGLLPQGLHAGAAPQLTRQPAQEYFARADITREQLRFIVTAEQEATARSMVQAWQVAFGLDVVVTIEVLEDEDLQARKARGQFDLTFATLYAHENSAHRVLQSWAALLYDNEDSELIIENTPQSLRDAQVHLLTQAIVLPMQPQHSLFVVAEGVSGFSTSAVGDNVFFGAMRK
ncbi:MAG: ABC transporter substrate-binding protein [Oscillospiraceae bacterium]|nr:ABC transporter substrate-binding protein [Oscillospiraceae bacterium]